MGYCVLSGSPEKTHALGRMFAEYLLPEDVIGFSGDLGAGKTCFIQGICRGLGVPEDIYITSPTFVILNRYKGRIPIYHIDLYRLTCTDEIIDLGYEEYLFGKGVCLIEWVERAAELLPDAYLKVDILSLSSAERRIEFFPFGPDYKRRFSDLDLLGEKKNI